jgi:Cache domain
MSNKNKYITRHRAVKSHCIVSIVIIIGILVFSLAITGKITVHALAHGTNQSWSSSFTARMMQVNNTNETTQEQQQQLLQSKTNMVKLLANMVENRLHEAATLLEITSVDPAVQKTPFADSISKVNMGIPGNLDLQKRKIALDILSKDKDFGSVYFTMPNGDVYIGEPYSQQKQLPRLNYADRDWYKAVTALNNTYISSVFVSASIHVPATAIVVPVYSTVVNGNNNNNNTDSTIKPLLSGYWVGILDLRSIDEIIKKLNVDQNERILVVDHNGTAIVDSYGNDTQNKNTTTAIKPLTQMKNFKSLLNGNVTSSIEIINGIKMLVMYEPFEAGTHRWGVVLTEPYHELVR